MKFRDWLNEWEGFAFPGTDQQYYNSPDYPRSKYKGKGFDGEPSKIKKIERMFKFKPTHIKKMKIK
jgi:hypothetical protein